MANCSVCGASNAGMGGVPLVKFDNVLYCKKCFVKAKGKLEKCSVCGSEVFQTNASYDTVNGKIVCSTCQEKLGMKKTGAGSNLPVETLTGVLADLMKAAVTDIEKVLFVVNGASGEALVGTDRRVIILKSGLATGSGTAGKYKGYFLNQIQAVDCACGLAYGRIQVTAPGTGDFLQADIGAARQAENCVTFLATNKDKFERLTETIRNSLLKKAI